MTLQSKPVPDQHEIRSLANALRMLSVDAVETAKSGHPGLPMGMADVATVLFSRFLKFDAAQPGLESDQPVEIEIALAHPVISLMDMTVQCQHQRHGVLGDGGRRVSRNSHKRYLELFGRGKIDIVVPCRTQGDQSRATRHKCTQCPGIQLVIDESANGREAMRHRGSLLV